jgi:hypothetical protein
MWIEDVRDFSVETEADGEVIRKEIDKDFFFDGPVALGVFLFADKDKKTGAFTEKKVMIIKFRKHLGGYKVESKVVLGGLENASRVVEKIREWLLDSEK